MNDNLRRFVTRQREKLMQAKTKTKPKGAHKVSPKRLARNRARVDTHASDLAGLVDDTDALAVLGTFDGAFLAKEYIVG